jgi:RNA polymerase sigma factor (sigma-70 family)
MNDHEIIEALRNHRYQSAMKPLYKYRPVILKMVTRFGGTKEDGEDIYQDALVIFCRKIKQADFTLTSSLNTYLFSISKNLWKNSLRERNKNIPEDLNSELPDEDYDFILHELKYRHAEEAFILLGEKCKELLSQFYFHKKPLAEIALNLGLANEKVAKNQKYRCLEKAKENYHHLKASE